MVAGLQTAKEKEVSIHGGHNNDPSKILTALSSESMNMLLVKRQRGIKIEEEGRRGVLCHIKQLLPLKMEEGIQKPRNADGFLKLEKARK